MEGLKEKIDYCRVDYAPGMYEYLTNDTNGRASKLLQKCYYYIRIKRIDKIPDGKKINKIYIRQ